MKNQVKQNVINIIVILIIVNLLSINSLNSQTVSIGCNNADFENGNFTNWVGNTGTYSNGIVNITGTGIVNGNHTMMTGTATDVNTANSALGNQEIPYVAPNGSIFSVRLGNSNAVSEADRLTYTMVVSNQNDLFYYWYAVVFEDPSHDLANQPRFEIDILDSIGQFIPDTPCGRYLAYAAPSSYIPGFYTSTLGYICKNWTLGGIDLSAYTGHTVTIQFTVTDCGYGTHFGYAYIDAGCAPMEITQNYIQGNNSGTLSAPFGFDYSWTGPGITTPDTNRTITIPVSYYGSVYTCIISSYLCCGTDTLTKIFDPIQINPSFSFTTNSTGDTLIFNNTSTITGNDSITNWFWNFGDGDTSILKNPTHHYLTNGNYNVVLTATSSTGCSNSTTLSVQTGIEISEFPDFSVQIFPNPFVNYININYNLNKASQVKIEVYDIVGNNIKVVENNTQKAGQYSNKLYFNKPDCSGIFFIKFIVNNSVYQKKVVKFNNN